MIETFPVARPVDLTISSWSAHALGYPLQNCNQAGAADQNWIAALVVVYIPFVLPEPVIATKMAWANGAAVAGNYDVGIYDSGGTRLINKGSTAAAGVAVLQVVDITDTPLNRGLYYMALVSDTSGATQKISAWTPTQGICQSLGLLEETLGALPLPATATFAKYTRAFIPAFGLYVNRVTP